MSTEYTNIASEINETYSAATLTIDGVDYDVKVHCCHSTVSSTDDICIIISDKYYKYVRLLATFFCKTNEMKIEDIQIELHDVNKHYGSAALEILLKIGTRYRTMKYYGIISYGDIKEQDHKDRLIHFYEKHGFTVDIEKMRLEKRISR